MHTELRILLEKLRSSHSLFRKSNVIACFKDSQSDDNPLILLIRLQDKLHLRELSAGMLMAGEVVGPFVAVLRCPFLSAPFKLAALDALESFLQQDMLEGESKHLGETLAVVVGAITRCKFVQTDVYCDELVQLAILNALQTVVRSSYRYLLTIVIITDIFDACHSLMLHASGGMAKQAHIYHLAERTTMEILRFVFSADFVEAQRVNGAISVSVLVLKVLDILDRQSAIFAPVTAKATVASLLPSPTMRVQSTLGNFLLDADSMDLVFALKAFRTMLCAPSDLLISLPDFVSIVRNDFAKRLVMICCRGGLPIPVLQKALDVVTVLMASLAPSLKLFVESVLRFLFIRALLHTRHLFASHDEFMRLSFEAAAASGANSSPTSTSANMPAAIVSGTSFTGPLMTSDEIEVILETLRDLVGDSSFIPMLYANFDCDPSKPDIALPLISYLGTCARYTLVCEPTELGSLREIGNLCMKCFRLVLKSFGDRRRAHMSNSDNCLKGPRESCPAYTFASTLRQSRIFKAILVEAALKFTRKPREGLEFLQKEGVLPHPLTPASVACFLRMAPTLPKDTTGAFLGELGKDNPSYEADGKVFHREVLESYVRSFELKGQSVLNCMRIFLSAFRLPGEAQQIDRILVAFSEHCHMWCTEGVSGLLENPEITYLLSFSIIMLNTDLHNPNIRSDRKMTSDQFVRNNTFYGSELKQTVPIPREFLEGIYVSIAETPIRTEKNDLSASMTPEMWMDMQLQADISVEKGLLFTTSFPADIIHKAIRLGTFGKVTVVDDVVSGGDDFDNDEKNNIGTNLLSLKGAGGSALLKSAELFGYHWVVDSDLIEVAWEDLFVVPLASFLAHRCTVAPSMPTLFSKSAPSGLGGAHSSTDATGLPLPNSAKSWRRRQASVHSLGHAIEIMLELLELLHSFDLVSIVDVVVLLLADFSGVMKDKVAGLLLSSIRCPDFHIPHIPQKLPTENTAAVTEGGDFSSSDVLLETLLSSLSARAALAVLLHLAHGQPTLLGTPSKAWRLVWSCLASLRDCALLPAIMVVDGDSDLLPPQVRAEFEARLCKMSPSSQGLADSSGGTAFVKKSASVMSLLGLGEVFFGGGGAISPVESTPTVAVQSRWDAGYEDALMWASKAEALTPRNRCNRVGGSSPTSAVATANSVSPIDECASPSYSNEKSRSPDAVELPEFYDASQPAGFAATIMASVVGAGTMSALDGDDKRGIFEAFTKLRTMVEVSGIAQLVSDTRFFSEDALLEFVKVMVEIIRREELRPTQPPQSGDIVASDQSTLVAAGGKLAALEMKSDNILEEVPRISMSSLSWMEMILVEVSLRNRDRFVLLWPLISNHMKQMIGNARGLSYALERRVTGIFKIATRMLSRDQIAGPILDVLGNIFSFPHSQQGSRNLEQDTVSELTPGRHETEGLPTSLLADVAGQVSAGIWRLLTQNVSVLPLLRLEQWQILFDIVAISAAAGGFSSIKAFECMAWLLHEPRLRAEVPVFCVVGLRPLLCNPHAATCVSAGAVQLLSNLHTRLEVLVKEGDADECANIGAVESDTPLLWESCWVPILQVLAEGAVDDRIAVRAAAVNALSTAILEHHVLRGVPPGVMVNALCDVIVPTICTLGKALIDSLSAPSASMHRRLAEDKDINSPDSYVGEVLRYDEKLADGMSATTQPSLQHPKAISGHHVPGRLGYARALLSAAHVSECEVVHFTCLIDALVDVFLQQLNALFHYPSFDKLWFGILHMLGYFLGAPHGFDHDMLLAEPDRDVQDRRVQELGAVVKAAASALDRALAALAELKEPDEKSGLWALTTETVAQFKSLPTSPEHLLSTRANIKTIQ